MPMTKKSARAIITCRNKIDRALETCLAQLTDSERQYAESYWGAHIKSSLNGYSYGSAPTSEAESVLDM